MGILRCVDTTQCGFGLSSLYPERFSLFSDDHTYRDFQGCSCWFNLNVFKEGRPHLGHSQQVMKVKNCVVIMYTVVHVF